MTVAADAGSPVCVAPDAGDPSPPSGLRERSAQRLPPFPSEPPVVADEDAVVYRGRVVTRGGEGIAGARVRWVGFPPLVDAPGRVFVWGAALTSRSGHFRISVPKVRPSGVGGSSEELLVVEADEMRRTLVISDPPDFSTIRLAPTAAVRIELHCRMPHAEPEVSFPAVAGIWPRSSRGKRRLRDEEVWTYRLLVPEAFEWPEPIVPGRDVWTLRGGPPGTGRFGVELALPRGERSRLEVSGFCGVATRELDVPDEGPVAPLVISLPDSNTALLELRLTGGGWTSETHLTDLWNEEYSERLGFTAAAPTLSRALPAGSYRLGDRERRGCRQTIELSPGDTRRVDLRADSCQVFRLPPSW